MENKYYTPQIEEFRVGFEFESLDRLSGNWEKNKVNLDTDLTNIAFACLRNTADKVRVKYLDSEDIESLGFGNYIPPHEYDHTWSKDNYELKCWFNKELPIIRILEYGTIIFHGNIKNRNELQVLLNQLGIK